MLLPPIRARKKVLGKCRPATMSELRGFVFDSRVVTLVANTMTFPGFLFKNIRASSCRIYIWNLAFSSFYWQLVSSLRDRPCMGLARLASHVLRETFFFGRPVFWFRKSSCFFSQKRVSRDAMFTNCFADWSLGEPLWKGVEGSRQEVKNVIVKRNCAFEFLRQKCPLHVFFFVCCHVCRVCVGSLLQSSFSVHTSLIFLSQKQKSLGRASLPDCKPSMVIWFCGGK